MVTQLGDPLRAAHLPVLDGAVALTEHGEPCLGALFLQLRFFRAFCAVLGTRLLTVFDALQVK